ncbi:MAG: hypothetical protein IJP18_08700 [Oscillospiraceae bacterium]|nr:hypothetical protein [Oscillospiraceae bacterium]
MKNLKLKIPDSIKNKFSGIKNVKLLVVLGFAGMFMILVSEFIGSDKNNDEKKLHDASSVVSEYADDMEVKLEKILGKIEGVGKVSVMITVDGTEEYIYAKEEKASISQNNDNKNTESENKYVFVQKEGNKEALLKKVINPDISGVVVVCEGGGVSSVREKVCNAVSVSLGIPTNRIYVDSLK